MKTKQILLIFIDIVLVYFGFLCGFSLRFLEKGTTDISFKNNSASLPYLVIIYIFFLAFSGAYQDRFKSFFSIIRKTVSGLFYGLLCGITFIYVFRIKWGTFPSSIFVFSFLIIAFFVCTAKVIIYKLSGGVYKRIIFVEEPQLKNIDTLSKMKDIDEIVIATKFIDKNELFYLIKIADLKNAELSIMPQLYDEIIAKKN